MSHCGCGASANRKEIRSLTGLYCRVLPSVYHSTCELPFHTERFSKATSSVRCKLRNAHLNAIETLSSVVEGVICDSLSIGILLGSTYALVMKEVEEVQDVSSNSEPLILYMV